MPELPEVETIVRELNKKILGRIFIDVWTDFPKSIKKPKSFQEFRKSLKKKKILGVKRRAKNIILTLSSSKSLLIHQKLTGHLLSGSWIFKKKTWVPKARGILDEKANQYIHLMFFLDRNMMLALSDKRKFAKIELWNTKDLEKDLKSLGPEPLDPGFTFEKFKQCLETRKRGKIKQVLMDQSVIAGVGNIYSDEILFRAGVYPLRQVSSLKEEELKRMFRFLKEVLNRSIKLKGESFSDFRTLSGEKGGFDTIRKVYGRKGERCSGCKARIQRIKIGSRSAHFCPKCQK
jgi:formamidopyrimidine-DNA glycosylase